MNFKRFMGRIGLLIFKWMTIDNCHCVSTPVRDIEKPSIIPRFLNTSVSMDDKRVTVYGRFQCPKHTTAEFDDGTVVKFDKVFDSRQSSTDFEMILHYDTSTYLPKFTLQSASESIEMYLNALEDTSVQSEFFGTNCQIGINSSSDDVSATYTTVVENCKSHHSIYDNFVFGLSKDGKIGSLDSYIYCFYLYNETMKYFKAPCPAPNTPSYITFYKDKMAEDNVELVYLKYVFKPMEPCSQQCVSDFKNWFFSII